jgi:hypothetical protein
MWSEKAEAGQRNQNQADAAATRSQEGDPEFSFRWNIAICAVSVSVSLGATASDTTALASSVPHSRWRRSLRLVREGRGRTARPSALAKVSDSVALGLVNALFDRVVDAITEAIDGALKAIFEFAQCLAAGVLASHLLSIERECGALDANLIQRFLRLFPAFVAALWAASALLSALVMRSEYRVQNPMMPPTAPSAVITAPR